MRSNQRGCGAKVTQLISLNEMKHSGWKDRKLEEKYQRMLSIGLVNHEYKDIIKGIYHPTAYKDVFTSQECYLVNKSRKFGHERNPCYRCSWCKKNLRTRQAPNDAEISISYMICTKDNLVFL